MYSNGEIEMVLHEIDMADNWDDIITEIADDTIIYDALA